MAGTGLGDFSLYAPLKFCAVCKYYPVKMWIKFNLKIWVGRGMEEQALFFLMGENANQNIFMLDNCGIYPNVEYTHLSPNTVWSRHPAHTRGKDTHPYSRLHYQP